MMANQLGRTCRASLSTLFAWIFARHLRKIICMLLLPCCGQMHHLPRRCSLQAGTGRISLDAMQKFASKYGGQALTFDELQLIFRDFKPGSDYMVSEEQFLVFFSKVSKTLINRDFDDMVAEMSQ